MKKYPYILFDLDGMMVNTDDGVFNCVCYAHEKLGYPIPDMETLKKYMGPPLKYSFVNFSGMTTEESEQALAFYRERYAATGLYEGHVFDGIPELLQALKEKGILLGTATSKPEEYASKILEHFDIAKYFDIMCGAELDGSVNHKHEVIELALKKLNNPDKARAVMVGDRKQDIDGAKLNGIKAIGVRFGYAEEGELEDAGSDYIAKDMEELTELLVSL